MWMAAKHNTFLFEVVCALFCNDLFIYLFINPKQFCMLLYTSCHLDEGTGCGAERMEVGKEFLLLSSDTTPLKQSNAVT